MKEIKTNTFEKEVLSGDKLVLVDFYGKNCGPCKMMGPVLEEVAKEKKGEVKVCKIEAIENRETSLAYKVTRIPVFIFFRDGEEVYRIEGATTKVNLINQIEKLNGKNVDKDRAVS